MIASSWTQTVLSHRINILGDQRGGQLPPQSTLVYSVSVREQKPTIMCIQYIVVDPGQS